jgi:hypothetical protein
MLDYRFRLLLACFFALAVVNSTSYAQITGATSNPEVKTVGPPPGQIETKASGTVSVQPGTTVTSAFARIGTIDGFGAFNSLSGFGTQPGGITGGSSPYNYRCGPWVGIPAGTYTLRACPIRVNGGAGGA